MAVLYTCPPTARITKVVARRIMTATDTIHASAGDGQNELRHKFLDGFHADLQNCQRWFPKGIKRERGACAFAHNAAAAPATVSGESTANLATGSE